MSFAFDYMQPKEGLYRHRHRTFRLLFCTKQKGSVTDVGSLGVYPKRKCSLPHFIVDLFRVFFTMCINTFSYFSTRVHYVFWHISTVNVNHTWFLLNQDSKLRISFLPLCI